MREPIYSFDEKDYLVEINEKKETYYVKVWLINQRKYYYFENFTLEQAKRKKTEQLNLNMGRRPEIIKHKR